MSQMAEATLAEVLQLLKRAEWHLHGVIDYLHEVTVGREPMNAVFDAQDAQDEVQAAIDLLEKVSGAAEEQAEGSSPLGSQFDLWPHPTAGPRGGLDHRYACWLLAGVLTAAQHDLLWFRAEEAGQVVSSVRPNNDRQASQEEQDEAHS
jgi:hypothetical protein